MLPPTPQSRHSPLPPTPCPSCFSFCRSPLPCPLAGTTAAMVAKYRPATPIMTLVVPYLKRDGLKWKLEGRYTARQALLTSGLLPMLAAPTPSGACDRWMHGNGCMGCMGQMDALCGRSGAACCSSSWV